MLNFRGTEAYFFEALKVLLDLANTYRQKVGVAQPLLGGTLAFEGDGSYLLYQLLFREPWRYLLDDDCPHQNVAFQERARLLRLLPEPDSKLHRPPSFAQSGAACASSVTPPTLQVVIAAADWKFSLYFLSSSSHPLPPTRGDGRHASRHPLSSSPGWKRQASS